MDRTEVIHNWAARCWTAAWSPGMAAGEDNSEKGEKGQADKADAGDLTSAQKKAAEDRLMTVSTRAREIRELQERVNSDVTPRLCKYSTQYMGRHCKG